MKVLLHNSFIQAYRFYSLVFWLAVAGAAFLVLSGSNHGRYVAVVCLVLSWVMWLYRRWLQRVSWIVAKTEADATEVRLVRNMGMYIAEFTPLPSRKVRYKKGRAFLHPDSWRQKDIFDGLWKEGEVYFDPATNEPVAVTVNEQTMWAKPVRGSFVNFVTGSRAPLPGAGEESAEEA